jgi:hypothetical protein
MSVSLKRLCVTSALFGLTLSGSTLVVSSVQSAGSGFRHATVRHDARPCRPSEIDACKPSGCCIVN